VIDFGRLASRVSEGAGHPYAFTAATAAVLIWGASGPLFGYSDTWQLVINTSTTIITFLMVFLIQGAQNRDTKAIQAKLDEILRAIPQADDRLRGIERDGRR
jgi:low affinity Fe/Cu permease